MTVGWAWPGDAADIAAVHVEVWRNAYPGLLPGDVLAGLSRSVLALRYHRAIRHGAGVLVARAGRDVIGFSTASRAAPEAPADGEVETLYVLDDWREQGIGRSLLREAARHLAARSCRSLFLWVLSDNPSRWFYERLGGRQAAHSTTRVGGQTVPQVAMVWNPISLLSSPA